MWKGYELLRLQQPLSTVWCKIRMADHLLETKMSSSYQALLVLCICLSCCCSVSLSVRIIGDEKQRTDGLLQYNALLCNNTVQGRYLLSDSRGYVCNIMEVNSLTGCCPREGEQFACQGCNIGSQCCNSYEYCVSCCLNPVRTTLEVVLKTKLARQPTAGSWTSLFDYCSGRCRHNSQSVVHENAYVSEDHHCFSARSTPPGVQVEMDAEDELADVFVYVGREGLSCDATCSAQKLSCREEKLAALNNCAELQKYNKCHGLCIPSTGPDQPAEVVSTAPRHMHPGACLYNTQVSQLSCKGYHLFSRRLCPCA
ncbi:uncharacterized protein [Physcomitrium patens]|uniref:SREBP regulating gene protein n=1 Tax=Physcomitrium patens TaxID=3218 RepID=A0A2K1IDG7_PHYPA|nr:uncharacterized protein LOC112277130 [Physcomitrium patens]PNR27323.1 hypothetical protein PHYPA_029475 [Physcomitrium patens]|eukprot:XP_024364914.1 uncharacterized protein LOC112277130 [Physcomitrella patens]